MGSGRWDAGAYTVFSASIASAPRDAVFTRTAATGAAPALTPTNFSVRESCDSAANPESTPIMLFSDNTGSMGELAEIIAKKGMGIIMGQLYERKPVTDPHILCGVVGDAEGSDQYPIQATQFEAEVGPATAQLTDLFIEGRGGANDGESYLLAWYLAAFKTRCDAIIKRHRKGYLFTIGDEAPNDVLTIGQIKQFFGDDVQGNYTAAKLLEIAAQNWHVFHLVVKPVANQAVEDRWRALLDKNIVMIEDHNKLAEVIVSIIQITEGDSHAKVAKSWDGSTSIVVANATRGLAAAPASGKGGVRRLTGAGKK